MQPYKINLYVYADSPDEAQHLEDKLKDFVVAKREQGIAVSAKKLSKALDAFGNNPFLLTYLR